MGAVTLVLVHHANQYLITDGYDNQEGLSRVLEGYRAILELHEEWRVPINLHLSGTLLEAVAWQQPNFLRLVGRLRDRGLLEPVGGAYAENIMPLFPADFNLRQLNEHLWLYRHHLGCPPAAVRACWVPERVWDTRKLAPILRSPRLLNGGYSYVFVDDRLVGDGGRACVVAGGRGLIAVPISTRLRYCIPPAGPEHWGQLEASVEVLKSAGGLLVYGDDLEKVAGVGPWDPAGPDRYRAFLGWLRSRPDLRPMLLSDALARHPPGGVRRLASGTYFELARCWGAGEDYRGWWEHPDWARYRRHLTLAARAVRSAGRARADVGLLELAWKHLMASAYETAWRWRGGRELAPWARALASHARAALAIVAAARWFGVRSAPAVLERDVDADGRSELVLAAGDLYAVLAPDFGGRLIYLFQRMSGRGVLLIGNPTDDWNWQEELNRYMDRPPNHPGALAEGGYPHDRWEVRRRQAAADHVVAELVNVEPASPLRGARKTVALPAAEAALGVCYRLDRRVPGLTVQFCLSPDYYRLLREGRRRVRPFRGPGWLGYYNADARVWVGTEAAACRLLPGDTVGHGLTVKVRAADTHFHLLVGCGEVDRPRWERLWSVFSGILCRE